MKKIIALGLVTASIAATSAFGQGYFTFQSGKSQAYDGFSTPGTVTTDTKVDVAFLWAAAGTTPTVDGLATSTPTTGNYTAPAAAWADIMNGQFTLGENAANDALVVATTAANGSIGYIPAGSSTVSSFGILGTTAGTTYTIYEISWNAAYTSAAAAQAAGSAVGWSAPIQYTVANSITTPLGYSIGSFGTFATPAATPEPTTMALAGLGGLSLLAFRRKK